MAISPKSPRKRAVKKSSAKESAPETTEVTDAPVPKTKKKAASIPVPVFQAAPAEKAAAKSPRKAAAKKEEAPAVEVTESDESDAREGRNRRRRRGGRGRRKPGAEGAVNENLENGESEEGDSSDESGEGTTHRRRRRRRATGDGVTPGEIVDEDGVPTVVKVREVREVRERPARSERGTRNRRDRGGRSDRNEQRDYREPYRRRGTIITDGEFLARRENVDREMVVRQIGDRIQIGVIEDNVMVEHYVNRNANVSYVGNVYLGRVQNVLPSTEAAFVDIGKGRNAVLYAGEVNWDAAGISETEPRKIEMVLKTGQPVLVQVTKDPIGQRVHALPAKSHFQVVTLSMFLVAE